MNEMSWTTYRSGSKGARLSSADWRDRTTWAAPSDGPDALLATAVAVNVAKQLDAIVAPVLSFGYKSTAQDGRRQSFLRHDQSRR